MTTLKTAVKQTIIDLKTISFLREGKQTPSVESMLMCPAKSHNRTYYDLLAHWPSAIVKSRTGHPPQYVDVIKESLINVEQGTF